MSIAVVITYESPPHLIERLDALLHQVDEVLVVDNGSNPAWREQVGHAVRSRAMPVEFLFNERNLGVAAALNRGFARVLERGLESAFAFDQDSVPAAGMVDEIRAVYASHPLRDRIAMVAPNVVVASADVRARFLVPRGRLLYDRVVCSGQRVLDNVSIVISSGALYDLRAFRQIGPFREDFFIDYVDTEYCLRARQEGYQIVVACRAVLNHQLGDQKKARLGPLTMHPLFHSPMRWYYISRNRMEMMRTYALRHPHWLLYELVINLYGLVRLVFFEDHKLRKMMAMIFGTWDGLMHRMGPIPHRRQAVLMPAKADQ